MEDAKKVLYDLTPWIDKVIFSKKKLGFKPDGLPGDIINYKIQIFWTHNGINFFYKLIGESKRIHKTYKSYQINKITSFEKPIVNPNGNLEYDDLRKRDLEISKLYSKFLISMYGITSNPESEIVKKPKEKMTLRKAHQILRNKNKLPK